MLPRVKIITYIAASMACFVLWACSEDERLVPDTEPERISFNIAISGKWETVTPTRSIEEKEIDCKAVKFKDSGLWIVPSVEEGIALAPKREDVPLTRGAVVTENNFYPSFRVYGYRFGNEGDWTETGLPADRELVINNEEAKPTVDEIWKTGAVHLWPGTNFSMRFFAWAPGDAVTVEEANGKPQMSYTVPQEAKEQKDLLVSVDASDASGGYLKNYPGDYRRPVNLRFYHAVTAVRVRAVGDIQGNISYVKLQGVKGSGTHVFGEKGWTLSGKNREFMQEIPEEITPDAENGTLIIDGDAIYMMVPQKLEESAELVVGLKDGGTMTGMIGGGGKEWRMGTTVTYRISRTEIIEEPVFDVTPDRHEFTHEGGRARYVVKSYIEKTAKGVTRLEAAPWKVTGYSLDNGKTWNTDKPHWLEFTDNGHGDTGSNGDGSDAAVSYDASVSPTSKITTGSENEHTEALRNAASRGSAGEPCDLAMYTVDYQAQNGLTTANCYVISAPGTYRLPLVYGNAIKQGRTNEVAYKPYAAKKSSNFLTPFLKHDDKDITAPCLQDNSGVIPDHARLVWNDVCVGFIEVNRELSDYEVSVDGRDRPVKYLTFTIPQATIDQGNALIAVCNNAGDILWSWHIWVTDTDLTATIPVTNYQNETLQMMPSPLGWDDEEATDGYPGREVLVRFVQDKTGAEDFLTLVQAPSYIYGNGNAPYYQYGRKDPIRPSLGEKMTDKIVYDANGEMQYINTPVDKPTNKLTIGANIQNPDRIYILSAKPNNSVARNLWHGNAITAKFTAMTVKTVYDPCPPGFVIPPMNAYTGFTKNGGNSNRNQPIDNHNIKDRNEYGFSFYTRRADTQPTETIYFPSVRNRDPNHGLETSGYTTKQNNFWTSAIHDLNPSGGCALYYEYDKPSKKDVIQPVNTPPRSTCACICPVKDL